MFIKDLFQHRLSPGLNFATPSRLAYYGETPEGDGGYEIPEDEGAIDYQSYEGDVLQRAQKNMRETARSADFLLFEGKSAQETKSMLSKQIGDIAAHEIAELGNDPNYAEQIKTG